MDPTPQDAMMETAPMEQPLDAGTIAKYEATLKDMLARSEKGGRAAFMTLYAKFKKFAYDSDFTDMYKGGGNELVKSDKNGFRAAVNRAAEYIDIYGADLYPQNPTTTVMPTGDAPKWSKARFELESKVLDMCMDKGDVETNMRRVLNEALLSGRGVLWYGFNARKGVTQAVFDTVENFGADPDAKNPEEINYIWRKRNKPRFEFEAQFNGQDGAPAALFDLKTLKGVGGNGSNVEYKVVYMKVGLYNFCRGENSVQMSAKAGEAPPVVDNSPRKYTFAENHLVCVEDWEIPFDLTGAWPARAIDFRLQPQELWPKPPMEPGLTHLEAMNWAYTFYMNRVKNQSGKVYARIRHKGASIGDEQTSLIAGSSENDGAFIDVEIPSSMDPDIRKMLQPLALDPSMQEFDRVWGLTNKAFEDATGLSDLMRSGQDANQLRTAADVEFKKSRSSSRVDDMRKQFVRFFDEVIADWSLMNRYLLTSDDITKWYGMEAGKLWGRLGDAQTKDMETSQRMQQATQIMQQAMQKSQMALQQSTQMGQPPPQPDIPSADAIEEQLGPPQVIVMEDWINEAKRKMTVGSMRVIDNLTFYFQSIAQMVASTPAGQKLNAGMLQELFKLHRYSDAAQGEVAEYVNAMGAMAGMMPVPGAPIAPPAPGGSPPGLPPQPAPQGAQQAAAGMAQ
jgi:hypothetical protein